MKAPVARDYAHPGLAAVLSFVFSGMGQIYNGQIGKGLTIVSFSAAGLLAVIAGALLVAYSLLGGGGRPELIAGIITFAAGIIVVGVLGLYSVYEAYATAMKKLAASEEQKPD